MVEEAGDGDFLLVAAGEGFDGLLAALALDGECLDPGGSGGVLARRTDEAPRAEAVEFREGKVFGDREVLREPFGLAVLADKAESLGPTHAGAVGWRKVTVYMDLSGKDGVEAEEGSESLGSARADEAGDADHFSSA